MNPSMALECRLNMSGMCLGRLWGHISDMRVMLFGHVPALFRTCVSRVLDVFGACVLDMLWSCLRHVGDKQNQKGHISGPRWIPEALRQLTNMKFHAR